MVVKVNKNKVERSIFRQRELIERSIDYLHVFIARLFPTITKFWPRIGIGRIDHSLGADDLRKNCGVIAAGRPNVRHLLAPFDAVECQHFVRLACDI